MTDPIVEGFAALSQLVNDEKWSTRLMKRVGEILSGPAESRELELGKLYAESEAQIVRLSGGTTYEDDVRNRVKPSFAASVQAYPRFQLLFAAKERQFFSIINDLAVAYAAELSRIIGRKVIENVIKLSADDAAWLDLYSDLETGFKFKPVRLRSMTDCAEAAAKLFDVWYTRNEALLGPWPSRKTFERAYAAVAAKNGFLPVMSNLLGVTPLGVLANEKARHLHELETETSTQARSIRVADEGLRRQTERLMQTVQELEETKRKLEVTAQARSEFIGVVSHQFRTPLSSVRWNAELLSDAFAEEKVDKQYKEAIDNMRSRAVYLIETLDRVFAALDIETGTMVLDLKPAFLWEVVQDVYEYYKRDIEKKGLKWKLNRDEKQLKEIPMDKVKMTSVLKIIIGNAVNYNKEGGSVTVEMAPKDVNGLRYMVCSVTDEGIGIPKDDLQKFFDKFYRSKQSILKVADGTGLGTYIIKNVIEAHHGFIEVTSEGTNKGTTITFGLPTERPKQG
jgi:signal transduction histidine kinase